MSKLPLKAILAVIGLVLTAIAKLIKCLDFIRDICDDGVVNQSLTYISEDVRAFTTDLFDWSDTFTNHMHDLEHDLD